MPPSRMRFVSACQQLLALGVVLAALGPAAGVVSLDVVRQAPGARGPADGAAAASGHLAAYVRASARPSRVATEAVDPVVHEYPLTAPEGAGAKDPGSARSALPQTRARVEAGRGGATEITSVPQPVRGYGAVGVTWEHGVAVAEDDIALEVRTRTGGTWSTWTPMEYHDDHGPDPDSDEGRRARPGTDEALVGDVDEVQVRVNLDEGTPPADMKLAVVDPGVTADAKVEAPAIDTAELGSADAGSPAPATPAVTDTTDTTDTADTAAPENGESAATTTPDAIALQATTVTPKPKIYSRAQWGADERMRDKSSLHYFEVHGGFVHHTVNANDYTRAQVPALLRSIYAYHTRSRGWSDIGYNFLVDRFGRIWEGRYGGVDRPVVGAHTLNYNDYSFAMSAIGNYDVKKPSKAMIQAYGALFAWKLSLHGIDPASTRQRIGSKYFQAINGHRDAGSTACPGRYLYAKIPRIRELAAQAQRDWSGRRLLPDLVGSSNPDLILRRSSDGRGVIIPTGGGLKLGKKATVSTGWSSADTVVVSPDLTGDGRSDLLVVPAKGRPSVRTGTGSGTFGKAHKSSRKLRHHDLITPVGRLDGDRYNDVVARHTKTGRLDLYRGKGTGGFKRVKLRGGWSHYNALAATGDLTGDGRADLVARDRKGRPFIYPGTGTGRFGHRLAVGGSWAAYDTITGFGDYTGDGLPDLFVRDSSSRKGYVVPSLGNGAFAPRVGPLKGSRKFGRITGGNVAGGPAPDLLGRKSGKLVRRVNTDAGTLGKPVVTNLDLSSSGTVLNVGDWDRDGHGDVVVRKATNGKLHLRRGNGRGGFASGITIGKGFKHVGLLAAVGDMTGDGYPDLMGQPQGGSMRIYPGNGKAGLRGSYAAYGRVNASQQVPTGLWNGDGAPDTFMRSGSSLTLYPGNGPGGLTGHRSVSVNLSPYDWVIGVGDLDVTGRPDLIVRKRGTGALFALEGTGSGFSAPRSLGGGMGAYELVG